MIRRFLFLLPCALLAARALAFNIQLTPDAGLAANPDALAAFERAAAAWENLFTDPITVNIQAGLDMLSPGVIGSTGSVFLQDDYDSVRTVLAASVSSDPGRSIVLSLPTAAQFQVNVPAGWAYDGQIASTKANFKALDYDALLAANNQPSLDQLFGTNDATITFSSNFAFDFDASDGVGAGLLDFETVATHEIGHALGFVSIVDAVDANLNNGPFSLPITALDLFRFPGSTGPANALAFSTAARTVLPGGTQVFSDTVNNFSLSTGVMNGDGAQASHWKNDDLTGLFIGIMDPTLANGVSEPITAADVRAFQLIGYDRPTGVPEPGTWAFLLAGFVALRCSRGLRPRRAAYSAAERF